MNNSFLILILNLKLKKKKNHLRCGTNLSTLQMKFTNGAWFGRALGIGNPHGEVLEGLKLKLTFSWGAIQER